jgi:hypothetical protein
VLECGEIGLTLGTCGFTILKHEPQHLRHVGLRRWGGCFQRGHESPEPFWREVYLVRYNNSLNAGEKQVVQYDMEGIIRGITTPTSISIHHQP